MMVYKASVKHKIFIYTYPFYLNKANMKFCLAVLCLAVIVAAADAETPNCGAGGVWSLCPSSCAPVATCAQPKPKPLPAGVACAAVCKAPGCVCNSGLVLNNNVCILASECNN